MARRAITTIRKDGPFFTKDPAKTFRQNVRVMMDAIAAEGEADVRVQLRAGAAGRARVTGTGLRVADDVQGRTRSLSGQRWAVTAVVSAHQPGLARAQAISLRAAASLLETRTRAFRKTKNRIGRTRKTNGAELLKGIA